MAEGLEIHPSLEPQQIPKGTAIKNLNLTGGFHFEWPRLSYLQIDSQPSLKSVQIIS